MDFDQAVSSVLSSFMIVANRAIHLVTSPYRTMRTIAKEQDLGQFVILYAVIILYFLISLSYKQEINKLPLTLFSFLLLFLVTILYFYLFSTITKKKGVTLKSFLFTLSYALIPTLIWFVFDFLLYVILPPPRTLSIYGKSFSLVYITFSMSLLIWKIILFYLAIRFASRLTFFAILYQILLYMCIFLPTSFLLYRLGIFRIPFI